MKDNRRTIGISENVYNRFKAICNLSGLKISRHAEKVLLEYIEKMEKNIGKNK
jgi:hypothetical protein